MTRIYEFHERIEHLFTRIWICIPHCWFFDYVNADTKEKYRQFYYRSEKQHMRKDVFRWRH